MIAVNNYFIRSYCQLLLHLLCKCFSRREVCKGGGDSCMVWCCLWFLECWDVPPAEKKSHWAWLPFGSWRRTAPEALILYKSHARQPHYLPFQIQRLPLILQGLAQPCRILSSWLISQHTSAGCLEEAWPPSLRTLCCCNLDPEVSIMVAKGRNGTHTDPGGER